MIDPQRLRTIVQLGLPIMAGMISFNLLTIVDTIMIGRLGAEALAAAGIAATGNMLAMAPVMGLAAGVQTLAARRMGEDRMHETARPLNAGLALSLMYGVPVTFLFFLIANTMMGFLNSDPSIANLAGPYFQMLLLGVTFAGFNFAFRGYWNGIGKSWVYMVTLFGMHVVNVVLNYALIFGKLGAPRLGITGAGIASASALATGSLIYLALALFGGARGHGFLKGGVPRALFGQVMNLALPTGVQQILLTAGYVTYFSLLGLIGSAAMAAGTVLIRLMMVIMTPAMGLGFGSMTLVSQALGKRDEDDAAQWGWDNFRLSLLIGSGIGLCFVLFPRMILAAFITDQAVLEIAVIPMRLLGVMGVMISGELALMYSLMGAGDNKRVMLVSVGGFWCCFLPTAYVVGVVLGAGLLGVWFCHMVFSTMVMSVFALLWRGDRWRRIVL